MDAGNAFERQVFAGIAASAVSSVTVVGDTRAAAQEATMAAVVSGATVVLGADLPDDLAGRRTGKPDVLARVAATWVPVDVKHHRLTEASEGSTLKWSPLDDIDPRTARVSEGLRFRRGKLADDAMQLAHYWRMLEALGLAGAPDVALGGVIDRDEKVWWIDLAEPRWRLWWADDPVSTLGWYDHEFAFRLDVIAHTLQRRVAGGLPRKVEPVWTSECGACPWREVCRSELEESDHVSLLPRSTYPKFVEHRRRHHVTRRAVAALDPVTAWVMHGDLPGGSKVDVAAVIEAAEAATPETSIVELIGARRATWIRRLAAAGVESVADVGVLDATTAGYGSASVGHLPELIDQARAVVAGVAHRRRGVDRVVVRRADVEVDVDMESCEAGVYLWGTRALESGDGSSPRYRPFVTWEELTPERESAVFVEFWTWLTEQREAAHASGRSFTAYCYTSAENTQMRRILARDLPGLPDPSVVEAFMASDGWVDLHEVFKRQIVTGHGNGLKQVAHLAGFTWRDDDPGGDQSTVWYALATGDPEADVRHEYRARLLAYNEDDIAATAELRGWMDRDAQTLPSIGARHG